MGTAAHTISLSRRLVTRYLAFALAGLFCCLTISIYLALEGRLFDLALVAAIVPLLVLVLGGFALSHAVHLQAQIEDQLIRLSADPGSASDQIERLDCDDPAAVGWNTLLNRAAMHDSISGLEQRLAASFGGKSEQRSSLLLDSLPDGMLLTDLHGVIVQANRSFATFTGESAASAPGKNLLELLRVDESINADEVRTAFVIQGPATVLLHRSNRIEDGVLRIARHAVLGENGSGQLYAWSIRDVTQQALIDESRDEFVSVATHELRTPLANIKAYAETLAIHEDIDVERQKEFCNIINGEATRLSRFVDEMLSISQIEAGSMTVDRRETELSRLLQDVLERVRPQMEQKQIAFEVKLPPKLPTLKLDKDKFQAALVNLVGNAAKYTPDGGSVLVELTLKPKHLEFSVTDTGIGIAPEELPKVFSRFFRSSDARVQEIGGNGLGLTFTQEVVRLHGGELKVESQLNHGSTFTVTLPLPEGKGA